MTSLRIEASVRGGLSPFQTLIGTLCFDDAFLGAFRRTHPCRVFVLRVSFSTPPSVDECSLGSRSTGYPSKLSRHHTSPFGGLAKPLPQLLPIESLSIWFPSVTFLGGHPPWLQVLPNDACP
jgi:hypothetical protein